MRKSFLPVLVAVGALALTAMPAKAALPLTLTNTCVPGFNACFNFSLTSTGTNAYAFSVTYVSGSLGVVTGVGIYGPSALAGYSAGTITGSGSWTQQIGTDSKCSDLPGANIQMCGESVPPPVSTGLFAGQTVTFNFTTTTDLTTETLATSGFVAHVQQYGPLNCSLKYRSVGESGTNASNTTPADCGTSTIPEPISMSLIGTGLIGLGFIRRRRKGSQVIDG